MSVVLPLPSIKSKKSVFPLVVPSTQEKIYFHRMTIKDEKLLLMAKESEDKTDAYVAVLQTVQNCSESKDFNIQDPKYTIFDLEYLFLNIRGQSVSNLITLTYYDPEDSQNYKIQINIEDIKVEGLKKPEDFTIKLSDSAGVVMKYPPASLYSNKDFLGNDNDAYQKLMVNCISKIYDLQNQYPADNYTEEELIVWLEALEIDQFQKINDFVSTIPVIKHTSHYKNTMGTERTIELATLSDFFTLH